MKKLFSILLVVSLFCAFAVNSNAFWNDWPTNLMHGYDLGSTINSGNAFITLTSSYRGGRLACKYKVNNYVLWKSYVASEDCYSNTASSTGVVTFFTGEYTYGTIQTENSSTTSFSVSGNQTSKPVGIQYYFEFDNSGEGHDTHSLYYRIYDI